MEKLVFDTSLQSTTITSENLGKIIDQMAHTLLIFCSWFICGFIVYIVIIYTIRDYESGYPVITKIQALEMLKIVNNLE